MGYAITWCEIREEAAERFLEELGLSATGDFEELPESPVSMAKLDTGWRVIWINEYAPTFLALNAVERLSKTRDVLLCLVEEHVMASSSEMWFGGKCQWRLSHQGENGPKGIELEGKVPECTAGIREEMERAQEANGGDNAEVDHMFEIPLKVAQQLVGFKHDEDSPHVIDSQFAVLSRLTKKSGFLSRVFGR
jgi:hypothetical protein